MALINVVRGLAALSWLAVIGAIAFVVMRAARGQSQKGSASMIIIIVIVALAALIVLGAFSDRLRGMIAGVTNSLGGDADVSQSSQQIMQGLDESGIDSDS